jgi:acetyl-CoA carboxylase biotin carboxyl carrier protein
MAIVSKQDLEALIEIFVSSDWKQLHVELPGLTIDLSKQPEPSPAEARPPELPGPPQIGPGARAENGVRQGMHDDSTAKEQQVPDGWVVVRAPNLGTFYRAPKPGASPYVEIGDEVVPTTEVCLIEVMKLFTSVTAGVHGTVRRICTSDGDLVEYNQALLVIEPKP